MGMVGRRRMRMARGEVDGDIKMEGGQGGGGGGFMELR